MDFTEKRTGNRVNNVQERLKASMKLLEWNQLKDSTMIKGNVPYMLI